MNHQTELIPFRDPSDSNKLYDWLKGKGWVSARHISAGTAWGDRVIRGIASDSKGLIISGQKGYCRIDEATPAEIDHAANWLQSQGSRMIQRAIDIRKQAASLICRGKNKAA